MTIAAQEGKPPFYRNVRFLSWLFQLVIFALIAGVVFWLLDNYRRNTAQSGVPTNFDFLSQPASFDIPGADFEPTQSVRSAYVIGLLNTIRVSVVGIIFATVLGILIGIGRLSKNWIVNKLSTVYVETVRNLPLLVIMTFTFLGLVLEFLPRIEDAWNISGLVIVSNRGIGVPWYQGTSGWALLGILATGILVWWVVARWQKSIFDRTGHTPHSALYGGLAFLAVLVVGWVASGGSVTLPAVDGRQLGGGIRVDPSFFAVLVALVVYTASHIAEIVRGSIQAVPVGQSEAATALALGGFQRMWNVILPQAMRIAIPPLGNQYLNLIKNSSLGAGFAYFELTNVTQVTVGNGSPAIPAFALALLFYVGLSLITSGVVNVANRRFKLVER